MCVVIFNLYTYCRDTDDECANFFKWLAILWTHDHALFFIIKDIVGSEPLSVNWKQKNRV